MWLSNTRLALIKVCFGDNYGESVSATFMKFHQIRMTLGPKLIMSQRLCEEEQVDPFWAAGLLEFVRSWLQDLAGSAANPG